MKLLCVGPGTARKAIPPQHRGFEGNILPVETAVYGGSYNELTPPKHAAMRGIYYNEINIIQPSNHLVCNNRILQIYIFERLLIHRVLQEFMVVCAERISFL